MQLTIAIPSFDRNELLEENLRTLLPQLTEDCEVLILDNASPRPLYESLASVLAEHVRIRVRVIRNRHNVGGGANILRCFEHCETEWMWLLGDDDRPSSDAIDAIIREIKRDNSNTFINFSSPCFQRHQVFETLGADGLALGVDSFSNLLFMSAGVYNVSALVSCLKYGYIYNYSWAPHVALLLAGLGERGRCRFVDTAIIAEYCQAAAENRWSPIGVLLGKMTLLDLPMSDSARTALARKISMKPSLEFLAVQLVIMAKGGAHTHDTLYYYDQICSRLYYYRQQIGWLWLRIKAYRMLVKFPFAAHFFLRIVYRYFGEWPLLARNPLDGIMGQDASHRS